MSAISQVLYYPNVASHEAESIPWIGVRQRRAVHPEKLVSLHNPLHQYQAPELQVGYFGECRSQLVESQSAVHNSPSMSRCRPLLLRQFKRPVMIPRAPARLSLVSRHLAGGNPSHSLYTAASPGQPDAPSSAHHRRPSPSSPSSATMSSQPEHPTLLIPGPIEFDDAVLQSMSHYRSVFLRSVGCCCIETGCPKHQSTDSH